MSETTNNGVCPHCDMGIVPTGSKLPWTIKFRKCSICHGDWRNYVKKPEPQPDVHPTNHMDPVGRRLCASWPSEDELRKLYQHPMADNPIPPFMDEHLVSQFGKLSAAESEAYSKMLNCKFINPDKEKAAREYSQLMELTLTYQWEDVRSIQCPVCCTGGFGCTPYTKCQVCRGGGYVKVVVIRPPKP